MLDTAGHNCVQREREWGNWLTDGANAIFKNQATGLSKKNEYAAVAEF